MVLWHSSRLAALYLTVAQYPLGPPIRSPEYPQTKESFMNACKLRCLTIAISFFLATGLLSAQEFSRAIPEEVGMSSERLGYLTTALEEYVAEGRLAGAVTTIIRRGQVVYNEAVGYRDREESEVMQSNAIFRIASQTKALVSVGVIMLQEEGLLDISDPVASYLPAFAETTVGVAREGIEYDVVKANRPITIRDLLTHTAGISYGTGPADSAWEAAEITGWYFAHRAEPIRLTIDRIADLPFTTHPGQAWVYGYSTDILGALVEEVSGMPLDEFIKDRITDPLGMHDTHFYLPPSKSHRLAAVYNLRRGETLLRAPEGPGMETQGQYVEGPRQSFSGGAGLLSTNRDYTRFLQMLLNGGSLNGTQLLSTASVNLMTVNHVGDLYRAPGMGFGLGFSVREDVTASGGPGSIGEFGWGGAYHSTYWVDPVEQLIVVYLTQVIPASGLDDHSNIRSLIYSAITERTPFLPAPQR